MFGRVAALSEGGASIDRRRGGDGAQTKQYGILFEDILSAIPYFAAPQCHLALAPNDMVEVGLVL